MGGREAVGGHSHGLMEVFGGVSTVRDSPPANETSEENEEAMAVPEDLSASSTHQQNNRGEKGTGKCISTN